jgi:hypothetical protein
MREIRLSGSGEGAVLSRPYLIKLSPGSVTWSVTPEFGIFFRHLL